MDKNKPSKSFVERENQRREEGNKNDQNSRARGKHVGNTVRPASKVTEQSKQYAVKVFAREKNQVQSKTWVQRVAPEKAQQNKDLHLKSTTSHIAPEIAKKKLEEIRQNQGKSALLARVKAQQSKTQTKQEPTRQVEQKSTKTSALQQRTQQQVPKTKTPTPKAPPTKGRTK